MGKAISPGTDRLDQRHEGTTEDAGLLARRHDDSLAVRAPVQSRGRPASRSDRIPQFIMPLGRDTIGDAARVCAPGVGVVGSRTIPLRRCASARRARQR